MVVTFVAATNITKKVPFFLEVWSNPVEATAKISRTHTEKAESCDLEQEKVEIDWHGDEEEVVIRVVTFHGQIVGEGDGGGDVIGELRIPKAAIVRYAAGARGEGSPDVSSVARSFPVNPLNLKKKKKLKPSELGVVEKFAYSQLTEKLNIETIDEREHDKLRNENESLRTSASSHGDSGGFFNLTTANGAATSKGPIMKLVLMFQIMPRPERKLKTTNFRSSSFDHLHDDNA